MTREVKRRSSSVAWRYLLWSAVGLAALIGSLSSFFLTRAVTFPHSACERAAPFFEGFVVEEATRSLVPPLVRCVWLDTDSPQQGEIHHESLWESGELGAVAALDTVAALAIARLRRRRRVDDVQD